MYDLSGNETPDNKHHGSARTCSVILGYTDLCNYVTISAAFTADGPEAAPLIIPSSHHRNIVLHRQADFTRTKPAFVDNAAPCRGHRVSSTDVLF